MRVVFIVFNFLFAVMNFWTFSVLASDATFNHGSSGQILFHIFGMILAMWLCWRFFCVSLESFLAYCVERKLESETADREEVDL